MKDSYIITPRQKKILKAIVEEYVKTAEPVGSKTLVENPEFYLDYSSATIRNEMAALEEMGLIVKTHTSSGRVPSEAGYRLYVQEILYEKEYNDDTINNEFPLIDDIIERNMLSREQAVRESMAMIADLTNYTSVVMGPSGYNAKIRKLQFVSITGRQAVILMVTDKGNVESKKIYVPETLSPEEIEKVVNILNEMLYDCPINQIYDRIKEKMQSNDMRDFINYYDQLIAAFVRTFTAMAKDDYSILGENKLLANPEFQSLDKIQSLLRAIEQKDIIKAVTDINKTEYGVQVRIGNENTINAMKDCTVITVPYESSDGELGTIAVIGPTRMEYQKIIPLLEYIAKSIKKI